jgi:hypothetical protein
MTRAARIAAATAALAVAGGAAALWWAGGAGPVVARERCTATVDGRSVTVDLEQARHAATMAAVAQRRGLPARAVTIALATAYQESDLYNLDYGDRDSLGLFQQRPSQGWGTPEQVRDPVYATNRFYDELVEIPDYRDAAVTEVAQAVQRSAYPDAYADHEPDARVLASALTGWSEAAFACTVRQAAYETQPEGADGLTDRARAVSAELDAAFGSLEMGGFAPGGVDSGHIEGSAHYDGRALDVFFRAYDDPATNRRGWAVAHWLVANADRLGVATVIYDDRIWTARRSAAGWRSYEHPSGNSANPTLRHLDHVHVDVA